MDVYIKSMNTTIKPLIHLECTPLSCGGSGCYCYGGCLVENRDGSWIELITHKEQIGRLP
jgi:hypothetical protein